MTTLKVKSTGKSIAVVLPDELRRHLRVDEGDVLYVSETATGVELTPLDPQFSEQLEIAERVMGEDRDVLRKLAE
ncbi:MAG: AbrB/MazE/SpoVT family DNA-binding domain-containing protein [Acidobacteriota bacterium]